MAKHLKDVETTKLKKCIEDIEKKLDKIFYHTEVLSDNASSLQSTEIYRNDNGEFFVKTFDQNDKDLGTLSEHSQDYLKRLVDEKRSQTDLVRANQNLVDKYARVYFSRHRSPTIHVSIVHVFQPDFEDSFIEDIKKEFMFKVPEQENETEFKEVSVKYVQESDYYLQKVVSYKTEKPHEVFSGIDSLEEYAELMENRFNKNKKEVMKQDMYNSRYNIKDYDTLSKIASKIKNRINPEFRTTEDTVSYVSSYNVSENESVVEISVRYSYSLD